MDADLAAMQRLQAGDDQALSELMERYKEPVFRLSWRYLRNEDDAAEVTEETFVRVYFKADRFRPSASVKSWLFAIAANLCRDRLRWRKRRKETPWPDMPEHEPAALSGESVNARQAMEQDEAVAAIQQTMATLPHKLRFPFVFCVLEDHSYDECAEVLSVSRKTVETRIYRARQRLQEALRKAR